jgi:heme-degrading monooxygenase HmoA
VEDRFGNIRHRIGRLCRELQQAFSAATALLAAAGFFRPTPMRCARQPKKGHLRPPKSISPLLSMRKGSTPETFIEDTQLERAPGANYERPQTGKAIAMIVVIFETWPTNAQRYIDMGEALRSRLETLDGFISIERFRSVNDPAKLVALSFWRDEAAVEAWRKNEAHRLVQAKSRQDVFRDYRLRVAAVLRDYGMFERDQAPQDSRLAHE